MTEMKLSLPQIKLAFAISLASLGFTRVQAQSVKPVILVQHPTFNSREPLNKPLIFNAPPPPDDINAPGNRIGGGQRGCEYIDKQLTALVPVYGHPGSGLVLGLTTAEHPTFWFYVPYSPTLSADFVLQDEAGEPFYYTPVLLSGTPGVISLSLPSTKPPLEIGKRYHWYFNIYCQPQEPPFSVDGWIKRDSLNPALKSQLEKATQRQRVAIFAAQGIWYEALTASAELRRTDSKRTDWAALLQAVGLDDNASAELRRTDSKRTDWAALLQAVGLDDIAPEPMVDCCQRGNSRLSTPQ